MTVRIELKQEADPGTLFALGAFDGSVGKAFPVTSLGDPVRAGTLIKAVVAPDGTSVTLTIELDQMPSGMRDAELGSHSFRFNPGDHSH